MPSFDGSVPAIPGPPITDEEMDGIFAEARARMVEGREKYGPSFNVADLKTDIVQELLDWINYGVLMVARIRRCVPDFEGKTSNELAEGAEAFMRRELAKRNGRP